MTRLLSLFLIVNLPWMLAAEDGAKPPQNWTQWRGPLGTGVAPGASPPIEWSEEKNVRWKTPLPGLGHSTPIIWENRIFVTAAIPYGKKLVQPRFSGAPGAHDNLPVSGPSKFVVLAIDRTTGKILWQKTMRRSLPHEGGHVSGSLASASMVTDGTSLFAFFGSRGLYCLDMEGELKWKKDFGKMNTKHGHGEGSSPTLHGDRIFVNWDHERESFVVALNKKTGEEEWRVTRDELTSWATPIVVENGGKPQLIVSGTKRIRAYDIADGTLIWECAGMSANVVASPVADKEMVYAGSSYVKRRIMGIRYRGAKGDLTGTGHVVWESVKGTPYVPSPLLYDGVLYYLAHYQGVLSRVDARTGDLAPGRLRLPALRNIYASPIGADGRIYITDLDGTTLVMSNEAEPELLAVNKLDDSFSASAVAVNGELFLRGRSHLYCIVERDKKERLP